MYSWKTTRTFCAILLLLPIVHLAYIASRDVLATMNPSPHAWDHELAHYAKVDRANPLPDKPLVVVGGRRVKLWHGLTDLLAPMPVLMRGLGDAE